MHLQQVTQVESTSTDLTQFELGILRIRVNLKMFHCYILLKGTKEMILTDNSPFSAECTIGMVMGIACR